MNRITNLFFLVIILNTGLFANEYLETNVTTETAPGPTTEVKKKTDTDGNTVVEKKTTRGNTHKPDTEYTFVISFNEKKTRRKRRKKIKQD